LHGWQARNGSKATGSVYVADAGYWLTRAGVPKYATIHALAGRPTPDLPAFAAALARLAPGTKVPLQFTAWDHRHRKRTTLVHIDWKWCAGLLEALSRKP
jgi:hypothetical protein